MNREQAIADIEALFPIDSQDEGTNKVGERLLAQAKKECEDWRNLPDSIIFRYAELCRYEENRQVRQTVSGSWDGRGEVFEIASAPEVKE